MPKGLLGTLLLCAVVLLPQLQGAPGDPATDATALVRSFVDWYVPKVLADDAKARAQRPAMRIAITQKPSLFTSNFLKLLQQDLAAQDKAHGEITGLDFDPFLFTQDACQRYEVGRATVRGASVLVEVYGVCDGKKATKPDVTAEMVQQSGKWVFANVHSGAGESLLDVLNQLQKSRKR